MIRSEQRIRRLVRLRGSSMRSYQDFKIPVEWMLDSGMICKVLFSFDELCFLSK